MAAPRTVSIAAIRRLPKIDSPDSSRVDAPRYVVSPTAFPWFLLAGFLSTAVAARSLAAEPASSAPPADAARTIVAASPVSEVFRRRAEAASRSVPEQVWRGLEQAGWRLRLAEFVTDAAPSLRGEHPRGWPAGMTWENTDAVHLPERRMLIFAEKRRDRDGGVVASHRVEGVIRHETGHAFDRASGGGGFRSASAAFLRAYADDASRIPGDRRRQLTYYLQRGDAGRQETFAEAFAVLLGGGSDAPHRADFVRSFPRVLRYVRQTIVEFRPHAPKAADVAVQRR